MAEQKVPETLKEVLYTALGEASVCWSEGPNGEFLTDRAIAAGKRVEQAILEHYAKDRQTQAPRPMLGDAIKQLIDECWPNGTCNEDQTLALLYQAMETAYQGEYN